MPPSTSTMTTVPAVPPVRKTAHSLYAHRETTAKKKKQRLNPPSPSQEDERMRRLYHDESAVLNDLAAARHMSSGGAGGDAADQDIRIEALRGYASALRCSARGVVARPGGERFGHSRGEVRRYEKLAWKLEAAAIAAAAAAASPASASAARGTSSRPKDDDAMFPMTSSLIGTRSFDKPLLCGEVGNLLDKNGRRHHRSGDEHRSGDDDHDRLREDRDDKDDDGQGRSFRAAILFNAALAHGQLARRGGLGRSEDYLETCAECLELASEEFCAARTSSSSSSAEESSTHANNADTNFAHRIEMAVSCNLGLVRLLHSRPSDASRHFERYADLSRSLIDAVRLRHGTSSPLVVDAVMHLTAAASNASRSYETGGRYEEALFMVGEALTLGETIREVFGEEMVRRRGMDLNELKYVEARVRLASGDAEWASAAFRAFMEGASASSARRDEHRAAAFHGLGLCCAAKDEHVEATRMFVSALTLRRSKCRYSSPHRGHHHSDHHRSVDVADTLHALSHVLRKREEYADALTTLEDALSSYETSLGPTHELTLRASIDMARLRRERNELSQSLEEAQRAALLLSSHPRISTSERLRGMYRDAALLANGVLDEMARTDGSTSSRSTSSRQGQDDEGGKRARRRESGKPGSLGFDRNKSYSWIGRRPDAAAA